MAAKTPTTKPGTNSKPKDAKGKDAKGKDAKGKADKAEGNPYQVPPPEEFWLRYSPHYEAPISGTSSLFLHLAIVLLCVGIAWLGWRFSHNRGLDLQAVRIPGGGGGDPNGQGDARGIGSGPVEDVTKEGKDDTTALPERVPLNIDQVKQARETFANDPDANRYISAGNENIESFAKLNKNLQNKLRDGVMPGQGKGGKGAGSGEGTGRGTGTGDGIGSGSGKLSDREKRMLRWVMIFDTYSPADYVKQLHGLGAIVAIPKGNDEYLVIEDLSARPVKLVPQDVAKLNRIYWIDDKPQGVLNVLQVKQSASHFVAFMPQELEVRLGEMEIKYQGLRDDEIFETKFKVYRSGAGYDVKVQSQQKK